MHNKKIILGIMTLLCLCSVVSIVSAGTADVAPSLNIPVVNNNYTTSIILSCNVGTTNESSGEVFNATFWRSASTGGAAETKIATENNISADMYQNITYVYDISSVTDSATYNFTCEVRNTTDSINSSGIYPVTLDSADPTYTFVLAKSNQADYKGLQTLTWTTADATAGVRRVSVSVASPNSDLCANQSWTSTSEADKTIDLDCTGTYTAYLSVIDDAGNTATTSDSFKVYAGGARAADAGVGAETFSIFGDGASGDVKTIIGVALLGLILWLIFKKK